MSIRTIAPRAAVAAVFLGLGGLTLGAAGHESAPVILDAPPSGYLIVADAELVPAFASLDAWLEATGRPSLLVNLDQLGSAGALCSPESRIAYLRSRGLKDVDVVLLGGVETVERLSGPAIGLRVVRAPVATLAQAWSYVHRFREREGLAVLGEVRPALHGPGAGSPPVFSAGALP